MNGARILIVEDERIVQMHLCSVVESLGHDVVGSARSPKEAHAAAEAHPPDLVLMDVRLAEGGDGVETACALSELYGCSILFLTANSDAETVSRASEASPSGYIIKPFTSAEVSASITTALASHTKQRASRAREHALESALDGLGEALLVIDEQGRVRFANPSASRLTGWSAASGAASGTATAEELVQFVSPAARSEFLAALAAVRAGGGPIELKAVELSEGSSARRAPSGWDITLEAAREGPKAGAWCLVTLRSTAVSHTPPRRRRRAQAFGAGTRLLVYSHDTFGLGHLRRSLNLIRTLAERYPGLSTLLVTGSPLAHGFELPPGTDYVKLPAVRKVAAASYEARFLSMSDDGVHALRESLILRTVEDYDPDVFLADHSPIGMNGELRPALDWLAREGHCHRLLGLRDIIDEPDRVVTGWRENDIYGVLRDHYDHVLIYGSKDFYDTVGAYRFPPDIAAKAHFLNHVTAPSEEPNDQGVDANRIVVSIGGGDGGTDTILVPFLTMLREHCDALRVHADILLGPLSGLERRAELEQLAEGLPVRLHGFLPDPTPLFRAAGLVIATAGYNTCVELLAHANRAILVPRVMHRHEQLLRARRFEALGLAACLHPRHVTPERLLEEIVRARRPAAGPLARARSLGSLPRNGAARLADFCSTLQLHAPPLARA